MAFPTDRFSIRFLGRNAASWLGEEEELKQLIIVIECLLPSTEKAGINSSLRRSSLSHTLKIFPAFLCGIQRTHQSVTWVFLCAYGCSESNRGVTTEKSWPLGGGEAKPQACFVSTATAKGCLASQVTWASGLFPVGFPLGFRGSEGMGQAH